MIATSLTDPLTLALSDGQWPKEKANEWYARQAWILGANFIPSTAVNQLEHWQANTFDPQTIDRELGYAQSIGMNTMRVFLHYLLWQQDAAGLQERMQQYLSISEGRSIKTIFVLFDDSWNPAGECGDQPLPKPGVHNSGWLQCPGKALHYDQEKWNILESYTKGIIGAFRTDPQILFWDIYNEPGNSDYGTSSLPLLQQVTRWAREAKPEQPISIGLWNDNESLNDFFLKHSDITTFHSYNDADIFRKEIQALQAYGRPIICTEYMARTNKSIFKTHLPILKEENAGAINWGLVSGKTNTIYPYLSAGGGPEPTLWFHDIFHADGTPFDTEEIHLIKGLTKTDHDH